MLSGGRIGTGCVVVAASLLAGCYASTEPATDVGTNGATLNAKGKANNGGAYSHFEFWVTGASSARIRPAGFFQWPEGASGPFSQKIGMLAAETQYSFRVCGRDYTTTEDVCAQTRTFTTKPPVEDKVEGGWWGGCCASAGVDATSGPSGENPRGSMYWNRGPSFEPVSTHFKGVVTCLVVEGKRAAVGAVGNITTSPPSTSTPANLLMTIEDGGAGVDTYHDTQLQGGATPPDCDAASFDSQGEVRPDVEFVVDDAQP